MKLSLSRWMREAAGGGPVLRACRLGRVGQDTSKVADLAEQHVAVGAMKASALRLREGIGRAQRQSRQRVLGPRERQRGNHQYARAPRPFDEFRQGFEAAHSRHIEIEQDHIDALAAQHFERVLRGTDGGEDFQIVGRLHHAPERGAGDQRIVDDHQPDGPAEARERSTVLCG